MGSGSFGVSDGADGAEMEGKSVGKFVEEELEELEAATGRNVVNSAIKSGCSAKSTLTSAETMSTTSAERWLT